MRIAGQANLVTILKFASYDCTVMPRKPKYISPGPRLLRHMAVQSVAVDLQRAGERVTLRSSGLSRGLKKLAQPSQPELRGVI